ncbi:hypothetical protein EN815_35415 [Mesorhizobium sp. M4B.F.Ca.ET.172.01.1.1]|nr:hypothetical protein EN815_35415 [Mesorhizobium sp. M4B.F.Ca.ET.172.01.1.1]
MLKSSGIPPRAFRRGRRNRRHANTSNISLVPAAPAGFQDAESPPAPRSFHLSLRLGAIALLAAVALAATWQLF